MGSVWSAIYGSWNQVIYAISNIDLADIVDILLIAYIIFKAIGFLRESRAGQLVKGLVILFLIYLLSTWFNLTTMQWVLNRIVDSLIIAVAVIFQPELRRILEKMGRTNFGRGQLFEDDATTISKCIDSVSRAAGSMQENRVGALIVFERKTQLGEVINTGTVLDAEASSSMINNIFFPKSPLHDGAMIIRNGRIYAAGCILPLTQREDLSLQLGTRHRAAIGMTENSDAVVLVVSEETGIISLVSNGKITRNYNPVSAGAELKRLMLDAENSEKGNTALAVLKKFIPIKKQKEGEEEQNEN